VREKGCAFGCFQRFERLKTGRPERVGRLGQRSPAFPFVFQALQKSGKGQVKGSGMEPPGHSRLLSGSLHIVCGKSPHGSPAPAIGLGFDGVQQTKIGFAAGANDSAFEPGPTLGAALHGL
jgi:hypothetical protein